MAGEFITGAVVSKLTLDTSKWSQSVSKVKSDQKAMTGMSDKMAGGFRKAGVAMTAAGGAILASMSKMIGSFVETGDVIDKMSKRTGFSAVTLSELAHAADITGTSLTSIEKGVKKMSKTIVDASEGMTTYQRAFERIGVDYNKLLEIPIEDQFMEIAMAIAEVEDPTVRAATAVDVFGRAGTQLLPLFAEGRDGIQALADEAHELGIIFDTEAAASAARLKDEQTRLKESFQGVGFALSETLVPALTDIVENFTEVIKKVSDWAKKNPELAGTIMKVVGAIGLIATGLGPILFMLPNMVKGFGLLKGMITKLPGPLKTMGLVAAAAFAGWEIGKRIGELKVLGKTIDEHVQDKMMDLIDTMELYKSEAEAGEGHTAAFAKRQKILAEASEKAGEKITNLHDAIDILNDKIPRSEKRLKRASEAEKDVTDNANLMNVALNTIKTRIESLESPLDNYTMQQLQLADAYANGEIGMGQYVARMAKLREEREKNLALFDEEEFAIDDAVEGVESYIAEWESMPSALESVLDQTGLQFGVFNDDLETSTKTTTENVKSKWGDMTDGLVTKWSQMFGDFVASGDIFKGDWSGFLGGLKTQFTDTLGNMLSEFTGTLMSGMMSGASSLLSDLGSSIGSMFGGDGKDGGVSSIAGGIDSLFSSLSSIVNPIGAIASAIGGIANLAALGSKPSGFSEHMWYLRETQENTQEMRDYMFIEQWKMLQYQIEQNHDIRDFIWKVNEKIKDQKPFLGSMKSSLSAIKDDTSKMPGLLGDINRSLGKLKGAQTGHTSTQPELVMLHGTPQDPEHVFRESQMNDLFGAIGRGATSQKIDISMPTSVNVNGTMVSDRDYMRTRLIPELLDALRANFRKSELKQLLGVST